MLLEDQAYGGGLMVPGYALGERTIYDKGVLRNENVPDFKIPMAKDVPWMEVFAAGTDKNGRSCPQCVDDSQCDSW